MSRDEQEILNDSYTAGSTTANLQRVATVASSAAKPAGQTFDEIDIWNRVFDPTTGSIRYVEVI